MMSSQLNLSAPACDDDHDPEALAVAVAQQLIISAVQATPISEYENLGLMQALGRVLAEDIISAINVPQHRNSAMDGYALYAADLPDSGVRELQVIGSSLAGHPFLGSIAAGQCVRITTGAIVPADLDTVIAQERVECLSEQLIRVDGRASLGDNIRQAGEDIKQGELILARGRKLNPADLGLLASIGMAEIKVFRPLRIAFFSSGDELTSVGAELQSGQIYDSNRYTLYGMLQQHHCLLTDLGIAADDPLALRQILSAVAASHDVIIASGGVSVGVADHVRQVFTELGELNLWKVAMKPGKPLTFGRINKAWFFGLPGNPVAVMVAFSQFVRPAIQQLAGETSAALPLLLSAQCLSPLKKRPGRTEFQRGILSYADNGQLTVIKTGEQGSGMLSSMSKANCFIVLPPAATRIEPGSMVQVQSFQGLW